MRLRLLLSATMLFAAPMMAQLAIVTDTVPDATFGQDYPAVNIVTSGATGPVTWSFVNAPSPPPGFAVGRSAQSNTAGTFCYGASVNGASAPVCTGAVQGFPGIYTFVIKAQDGVNSVQKTFSFTLNNTLRISTQELPDVAAGQAFSAQLIPAGGTGPYTWQLADGTLPPGITLNGSTGLISGPAPAISASYFFTIRVNDTSSGLFALRNFVINVLGTLQITTPSLPQTVLNQAMTPFTMQAAGGQNIGWSIPNGWTLPAGLNLSSQGVLSGTPTIAGSYRFVIQLNSSTQTEPVAKYFTLYVTLGTLGIVEADLPIGTVGVPYQFALTPSGGLPPYSWAFDTNVTQGMHINADTGTITGTPQSIGSFPLPVAITDATGTRVVKAFTLAIPGPLTLSTTPPLPNASQGTTYSQSLNANVTGGQPPYHWAVTAGLLPAGLNLDAVTGKIDGVATTLGVFPFIVTVTDFALHASAAQFSITVVPNIAISTISLADGTTGVPYSQTLTAVGAQGTVTWSVLSGNLPANLLLNAATGEISGTPTATGTFNFTIRAADGVSVPSQRALSITIYAPLNLTTLSLPNASRAINYSQTLAASGGKAPFTWAITSGNLPPGFSLNAATGLLQGITSTEAVFPFAVTVTDAGQRTSTRQLSITVVHGIAITTTSLPDGVIGAPYSQTLNATGAQGTITWSLLSGTLPGGLSLNISTGTISGPPTLPGTFNFTIRAFDGISQPSDQALSIQIVSSLTISTTTLPSGFTGVAYSQALSATGALGPLTWSVLSGSLPNGLTLNASTGVISGPPTTPGTFNFTIRAVDGISTPADRALSITIVSGLAITTASLPGGFTGVAYSQTLSAAGALGPLTWSVLSGSLPNGLTLNASTGIISGPPTTPGTFNFTIRVVDGISTPADRALSITIVTAISISTASLPDGITGTQYSQQLNATGAQGPITWSVFSGALPAGLGLNASTGVISGPPTAPGIANFTIRATDGVSPPNDRTLSISIFAPLSISTISLPNGSRTVAYSQNLAASGGKTPYTWSLFTGNLPAGLGLSSAGVISGTPTAAGTSQFHVNVSDSGPQSALATFTITIIDVVAPVTITTGNLNGSLGVAFSQTLAATGGTAPYTWTITSGALPAGLQLNASTGAIAGTPTAAGTFNVTFTVTDQVQGAGSKGLTITITAPALPAVTFNSLPDSSPAARQPSVSVNLASPYPAALTGTLTLTFASSVGGDDQTVQFSNASHTLSFSIAAGATSATFTGGTPAVITGTVAGTITITAQFSAGGQNVTPSPAPTKTITVELAAPVISTVTLTRSGSTLTVVVNGYATSREMVSGTYRFSATSGNTLSQSDIVVQLSSAFTTWFNGAASNATGGNFKLTVPFTIQGDATAVSLVSVTVTNTRGTSAAVGP